MFQSDVEGVARWYFLGTQNPIDLPSWLPETTDAKLFRRVLEGTIDSYFLHGLGVQLGVYM